ncbi:hypothetical protein VCRA2113O117_70083 [Vibrio crassostreae]|nr:hypothetical protein VCRA2110O113_100106 [Vibrio crassostreae]CAK2573882.1 hypothetical protein VCRA2119O125_100106 [Vibrio crassostreae]CAK3046515.1 hypothetical protein VCRA2113O117_70083 [Vibrio crassostreae]CAK3127499.1 hypothetical protein VCRA2122O129_100084 [Vibrio crassostreae]
MIQEKGSTTERNIINNLASGKIAFILSKQTALVTTLVTKTKVKPINNIKNQLLKKPVQLTPAPPNVWKGR